MRTCIIKYEKKIKLVKNCINLIYFAYLHEVRIKIIFFTFTINEIVFKIQVLEKWERETTKLNVFYDNKLWRNYWCNYLQIKKKLLT